MMRISGALLADQTTLAADGLRSSSLTATVKVCGAEL